MNIFVHAHIFTYRIIDSVIADITARIVERAALAYCRITDHSAVSACWIVCK